MLLSGCVPTNHVYVKKISSQPQIKQVLVMVEYLDIKDDIKGFWDFEETRNLEQQDKLYEISSKMVGSKGYKNTDMSLKSSGLIINRSFFVDHLIGKDMQKKAIGPPYILRSINLSNENIQGLEILLAELNVPMSSVMSDMRSYVKNNYSKEIQALDLPSDTAILIIQSYKPRVSIFVNMQVDLVGSPSNSRAFVDMNNHIRPTTYAYFIHSGTGDLLWSNKTTLITDKNQQKFFNELPMNNLP